MASPDHAEAAKIIESAVFYSRLTKWDEQFDHLPVHTIDRHLEYFLAFRALAPPALNPLVIDITDTLDTKLAAIACYRTQFPPERQAMLDRFQVFARQQGMAAGFGAGEVLSSPSPWGTCDLMGLLFGPPPERPKR